MIRVLTMIAVTGFLLAAACLTAAVMIGGPDAIARGSWNIAAGDWDGRHWGRDSDFDPDFDIDDRVATGPQTSRTLAWTGDHTLRVGVPANVRYVQGSGAGSVVVTGPEPIVRRVVIDDGRIKVRGHRWMHRRLDIVVTAPGIDTFKLSGANRLTIEGYRQPRLSVELSGASQVTATGETESVELDMSGAGEADLGGLKTRDADVDISGAGEATLAPTGRARLDISGMGEVTLLTKPAQLETDISGAGTVHERPAEAPAPAPKGART